jgi:hypothetical protein
MVEKQVTQSWMKGGGCVTQRRAKDMRLELGSQPSHSGSLRLLQ